MKGALSNSKKFIMAGNAIFTVRSEATGNRFTYRVKKVDEKKSNTGKPFYFVSVLTGSNNEGDYTYIGMLREGQFIHGKKSPITTDATSVKAFDWLLKNLDNLNDKATIYHEGCCGRCGRTLTVPESIETGFGPECSKHIH